MNIGTQQGQDLKAYWIANNGMTPKAAEEHLNFLRGATTVVYRNSNERGCELLPSNKLY